LCGGEEGFGEMVEDGAWFRECLERGSLSRGECFAENSCWHVDGGVLIAENSAREKLKVRKEYLVE